MYARTVVGSRRGFTLLELLIVISIGVIMTTVVVQSFARYTRERSAQQAAYLLSRDLRLTRARAIGSRQAVSLVVLRDRRAYVIRDGEGTVVAYRTFAAGSELMIDDISLELPGDSVTFSPHGVVMDMSGASGGLAEAIIGSGDRDYVVRFNATGSSRIEER